MMRYESIADLPYVCQLNLPAAAQQVYKDAWNHACDEGADARAARARAWEAVRSRFTRDHRTGDWMPTPKPLHEMPQPRASAALHRA